MSEALILEKQKHISHHATTVVGVQGGPSKKSLKHGEKNTYVANVYKILKYYTCTKNMFYMWKRHNLEVHWTNIQRKGSSSNEIIHFKVKGLRGDYPNSSQIVPFYPVQTIQLCCSLL